MVINGPHVQSCAGRNRVWTAGKTMSLHRFLSHSVSVEAVLGVLLAVSVGTLVIPAAGEAFKRRVVADVARKLSVLTQAKQTYVAVHEISGTPTGVTELVPHYLDRWPCSMVGHCSDFKTGLAGHPETFRTATLDELEDPVTFQEASDKLYGSPQDFLFKQG